MTTRTITQEATVEGNELVITRKNSETRVSLPELLEWIAANRPDLLEPYVLEPEGDDE